MLDRAHRPLEIWGGWAEIPVGVVFVMRGERFERIELYPPEAVDEMKARVAELTAVRADSAGADR